MRGLPAAPSISLGEAMHATRTIGPSVCLEDATLPRCVADRKAWRGVIPIAKRVCNYGFITLV